MKKKPVVLVELNEINFDIVKKYIDAYPDCFKFLKILVNKKMVRTVGEERYEENEPWIQWVSVHTGMTFAEHQVYRLGDIINNNITQIYEYLEGKGFKVGAISPMNTANRTLQPSYFIPDPWTLTQPDSTVWSKLIHNAVSQAVNDNSKSRLTLKTAAVIALSMIRCVSFKKYPIYLSLLGQSRGKPWVKALIFDLFLNDLHRYLFLKKRPDFSSVFLNAGAHIQHHYFLNSEPVQKISTVRNPSWYVDPNADPMRDMLIVYDKIIKDYILCEESELIVVTGLSQIPYDRQKFYYRLSEHSDFISRLSIKYVSVQPRMTRDFLVDFSSKDDLDIALNVFRTVVVENDGILLFGEIEKRDLSLFITLTYPHEITTNTMICFSGGRLALLPHVVFVALKNGMHSREGYAYFSDRIAQHAPRDGEHVKSLYSSIVNYFK
jgi:hypothetical protein